MAASLLDSLMQQLESRGAIDQIAGKLGVEPAKANSAVSAGIPAILAGLAKNAKDPAGASALANALDKDHDGSVLNDDAYFDAYEEKQGEKILGHVFGNQAPAVESQVSALGGLDASQGTELLKMLAPLIMGFLGKQKSSGGLDVSALSQILGGGGSGGLQLPGGLAEILGGLGGSSSASASSATSGKASSGGLGAILGKLFGRK